MYWLGGYFKYCSCMYVQKLPSFSCKSTEVQLFLVSHSVHICGSFGFRSASITVKLNTNTAVYFSGPLGMLLTVLKM